MPRFCLFGEILPHQKAPTIQNNMDFSPVHAKHTKKRTTTPHHHHFCQNNPNRQNPPKPNQTQQNQTKPTRTADPAWSLVSTISCFFFFFFFFSCNKKKLPQEALSCVYMGFAWFWLVLVSFVWFCRSQPPSHKTHSRHPLCD